MRKVLLGLGLLVAVALTAPRQADAHVSISIGFPGFGFFLSGPPVLYAPPVVYAPPVYAPPVYYAPYYSPRVVYAPYFHDRGRHRGWYR